jgi:hypothetical protein
MAIGSTQPFRPAGTVSISASTTSANASLAGGGDSVLVYNAAASVAFIRFGADPSLLAANTDTPVPPGGRLLFGVNPLITYGAAALAGGSGAVYFTRGDGSTY